ncbi:menaquinone biosynthesis protein [Brevibacillus sp. SYSU BS000544]|uniref:menaquinone biosynthesis protein n=1 Tax=Brevibacillus sp. SYSU BS000544 TaxID=3416443 RepID=UPI003CE59728
MNKILRIGQIKYTNTLPVYYYFDQQRFEDKIDFTQQVPAQLNQAMAKGEIDVGPISSFSYAEHEDQYLVLPDLSVSAKGRVRSIYLFSKKPIEELQEAKIALTNTSATSINLLKVVLQKFLNLSVSYEMSQPVLDEMMIKADAALLIGDEALLAYRTNTRYLVYDLAELWYRYTGYSMTFALWTVRKEAIRQHASLLREVHEAFLDSKEKSLQNLDKMVDYVLTHFGGDAASWLEYFRGLTYEFGPEQRRGLEYYFACTADIGLLAKPVTVSLWEDSAKRIKTT